MRFQFKISIFNQLFIILFDIYNHPRMIVQSFLDDCRRSDVLLPSYLVKEVRGSLSSSLKLLLDTRLLPLGTSAKTLPTLSW